MIRLSWFVSMLSVASASAQMVFEHQHADLGEVRRGSGCQHVFPFSVSDVPVEIVEVKASCGCVRPTLERKSYPPGAKGTLLLGIHTLSQPTGPKKFELTVVVRDPQERTLTLTAEARFQPGLITEPSNLLVHINGSRVLERVVRLQTGDHSTFKLQPPSSSSPLVQVDPVKPASADQHEVTVRIHPDFAVGHHEEVVRIPTDHPDYPAIELPISVYRNGRFAVAPEVIRLPMSNLGADPVYRRVLLQDRQGKSVKVDKLISNHPSITAEWTPTGPRLLIDPAKLDGPINATVQVQIREPIATQLAIPVIVTP